MFICIDTLQCAGTGKTLTAAYQDYEHHHGNDDAANCTFYERAEPIEVDVIILPKQIITKHSG